MDGKCDAPSRSVSEPRFCFGSSVRGTAQSVLEVCCASSFVEVGFASVGMQNVGGEQSESATGGTDSERQGPTAVPHVASATQRRIGSEAPAANLNVSI